MTVDNQFPKDALGQAWPAPHGVAHDTDRTR